MGRDYLVVRRRHAASDSASHAVTFSPRDTSLTPILAAIAKTHGYLFEVCSQQPRQAPGEPNSAAASDYDCDTGLAIIAIGNLARDLALEIGCFGVRLFDSASQMEGVSDFPFRRALVLYDGTSPDELCSIMADLSRRGVSFGLLPVDATPNSHLALLKALLFPVVEVEDVDWPETISTGPDDRAYAPQSAIHPTDQQLGHRLLVFNGHGNAIDIGKEGVIVCARGMSLDSQQRSLYPCFRDGLCFRQPLFERSPTSIDGLLDPIRFRHPLVLLLGCGTMPLGNIPFELGGTIVGRIRGSHSLAGIATLGILYHDFRMEMFLLALLLDGHALGDAVHLFNTWHRDFYGHTTPGNGGYGPLVAFGNPGFRVRSSLLQRPAFLKRNNGDATISASMIRFSGNGLAFLKFTGADSTSLKDKALNTCLTLRGTTIPLGSGKGGQVANTYVCLKSKAPSIARAPIAFSRMDYERRFKESAALRDSAVFLSFWRFFLSKISGLSARKDNEGTAKLHEAHEARNRVETLLLKYLSTNSFESQAGSPTSDGVAAHDAVFSYWCGWQKAMLEAAYLYVCESGGFTFHLWQDLYRRKRSGENVRPCPSCGRQGFTLSYQSHIDRSDAHELIHCSVCGVMGEAAAEIGISVRGLEQPATPGAEFTVLVDVENLKATTLIGYLTLIRECWFHQTPDKAATLGATFEPRSRGTLSLSLKISDRLSVGLYPLTVIGVLNGGLVHVRCHISVF
jgi:hypothetical protein